MLPNRSNLGRCVGVLMASIGAAAAAKPSGGVPSESSRAEVGSPRSTSSSIPVVPPAMRVTQNASDRTVIQAKPPNPASVSMEMSPDRSVSVGTEISFRVTTRKPGYLLLVDIDANGNMSQIFPSPEMIVQSEDAARNFIKPGEELLIPSPEARKHGFDYVITPPTGEAAVVAILSERRVQILDLPDDTRRPRTEAETIGYLVGWTNGLRVPDPATGKLQPSNWSFDIELYSIR
jgi:Domain of unknown function (DUF4384)